MKAKGIKIEWSADEDGRRDAVVEVVGIKYLVVVATLQAPRLGYELNEANVHRLRREAVTAGHPVIWYITRHGSSGLTEYGSADSLDAAARAAQSCTLLVKPAAPPKWLQRGEQVISKFDAHEGDFIWCKVLTNPSTRNTRRGWTAVTEIGPRSAPTRFAPNGEPAWLRGADGVAHSLSRTGTQVRCPHPHAE